MNMESIAEEPPMVAEIRALWKRAKDRQGLMKFVDKYVDFAEKLKVKYPDAERRRAYHALIGSGMRASEADIIEEDFPGEDSVISFLESLAKE